MAQVNSQVAASTDGPTRTSTSDAAIRRATIRHIVAPWISSGCRLRISRDGGQESRPYSGARRSRSALAITDTELNVIAALAIIGLRSRPKTGYSTPAAMGTPSTL
jgi:hypothetical protein